MAKTNKQVLEHMIKYIEQIEEANEMFNADISALKGNSVYRNSVSLCLLQIGELVNKLSDEYRQSTEEQIPWKAVRGLRNVVAHEYGLIDCDTLWETLQADIPALKSFCISQIKCFEKK